MSRNDEIDHLIAAALSALNDLSELATKRNELYAINQAEQDIHEIRKMFEQEPDD